MSDSPQGIAIKALLDEAYEELGDVTKCESWEDTLARAHSKNFLKETFKFLEKAPAVDKGKNPYV